MLNDCERKYLLHYYEYWNGWSNNAPETARRLYRLRSLQSVPTWRGMLTHGGLQWALNQLKTTEELPSLLKVFEYVGNLIDAQYNFSADRRYWSVRVKDPSWFGLVEHEHEIPLSRDTKGHVLASVCKAVSNVYASDLWDEITNSVDSWVAIEERSFFYLEGVKIWAIPDLMYRRSTDNRMVIVDWKTGKPNPENDAVQIAAYAAYAHLEQEVPLEEITGVLAFTRGDSLETVETEASLEQIRSFAQLAKASMEAMTAKLVQQDNSVELTRKVNVPLPIVDFPKTTETYKCTRCNFRGECYPDGYTA